MSFFSATDTASVRLTTPSLAMMLLTWNFTVDRLRMRPWRAISLFVSPLCHEDPVDESRQQHPLSDGEGRQQDSVHRPPRRPHPPNRMNTGKNVST